MYSFPAKLSSLRADTILNLDNVCELSYILFKRAITIKRNMVQSRNRHHLIKN